MTRGRRTTIARHVSEEALDRAIQEAKHEGDVHLLQRLFFVKNCYRGDTVREAASRVGVSQSTGNRWINTWNEGGMSGLKPGFGGGRPPKLDQTQRSELKELLRSDAPQTYAGIQSEISHRYDVEYSEEYIPQLLKNLDLSP